MQQINRKKIGVWLTGCDLCVIAPLVLSVVALWDYHVFSYLIDHFEKTPKLKLYGDALEYMTIAGHYKTWRDPFTYIGNRTTYGYPLLLFIIKSLCHPQGFDAWIKSVIHFQIFFHVFSCVVFYIFFLRRLFSKAGLPAIAALAAGAALMADPVLIINTAIPQTDTFAMDLLMINATIFASCRKAERPVDFIMLFLNGLLMAYAVLVRPSSFGFSLIAFYIAGLLKLFIDRELRGPKGAGLVIMAFTSLAVILPSMIHVWQVEHSFSLFDTSFMQDNLHRALQNGLSLVRAEFGLKWLHKSHADMPGVHDPYLYKVYGSRCRVFSLMSWSECLLSRPQAIPVFFVKKVTALFDDPLLPSNMRELERLFEVFYFCGFISLIIMTGMHLFPSAPKPVWPGFQWTGFLLTLLAIHSIVQIESRYGFALKPFCLASLFLGYAAAKNSGKRGYRWWLAAMIVAGVFFLYQIFSWDKVPPV